MKFFWVELNGAINDIYKEWVKTACARVPQLVFKPCFSSNVNYVSEPDP